MNEDILKALLDTEDNPELVVPMERFRVDFKVKAIGLKDIKRFQMQATHMVGKSEVVDEELLACLLIAEASVVPNWKAPELLEKYGTNKAHEVVAKRLLDGEKAYLSSKIMDVSGFNMNARINQIKN